MSPALITVGSDRIVLDEGVLSRLAACGTIVWRIEAAPGDVFVEMRLEAGRLLANTWNGWLVEADPDTGAVLGRRLVK